MLVFETTFKNGINVEVYDDSDVPTMDNYMVVYTSELKVAQAKSTNSPREVFNILNELQALEVEE